MGFKGLDGIIAKIDRLGSSSELTSAELKTLAEAAMKALTEGEKAQRGMEKLLTDADRLAKMNADLEKQGAHAEMGKLGQSFTGVTVLPGTPGLAPGELYTPEQIGQRVNPQTGGKTMADQLDDMSKRMEKLLGPDNYLAKLIEVEIPYLRTGARSAQEAQAFVQAVLLPFMAGLQRDMAEPKMSPEQRNMILELIHLAQTGQTYLQDIDGKVSNSAKKTQDAVNALDKQKSDMQNFADNIGHKVDNVAQKVEETHKTVSAGMANVSGGGGGLGGSAAAEGTKKDIQVGVEKAVGTVLTKVAETASAQKQAAQAILDQINQKANETKEEVRKAAEQAKKDAEEAKQRMLGLGNELMYGVAQTVIENDHLTAEELERLNLARGTAT